MSYINQYIFVVPAILAGVSLLFLFISNNYFKKIISIVIFKASIISFIICLMIKNNESPDSQLSIELISTGLIITFITVAFAIVITLNDKR